MQLHVPLLVSLCDSRQKDFCNEKRGTNANPKLYCDKIAQEKSFLNKKKTHKVTENSQYFLTKITQNRKLYITNCNNTCDCIDIHV